MRPLESLLEHFWRWRFHRQMGAVRKSLGEAYKFERGYTYLICFDRNAVSREVMNRVGDYLSRKAISALIIGTHGEPFPNRIGLYRLEKPE